MANYSHKKFARTTYSLATIHPLLTDRKTHRQMTTMLIARPLLMFALLAA